MYYHLAIIDILPELIGAIIVVLAGSMWGSFWAYRTWRKKEFTSFLVLALNSLRQETSTDAQGKTTTTYQLRLRTLFERDLKAVLPHPTMYQKVQKAITQTKPGDPILRFEKTEAWYILNAILNKISEQYSTGILYCDAGKEVTCKRYIFCLTFEREGEMYSYKPRVMMMQKEVFLQFPETGEIQLEAPHHSTRVKTLRCLKQEYQRNPHLFMEVEICF